MAPLLDQLHPIVGAKSAGLIVVDTTQSGDHAVNQFGATSSGIDPDRMAIYNRDYAKYETTIVMKGFTTTPGEIIIDPDFEDFHAVSLRPDVVFSKENFGIFHRFGVRLNEEKAWCDVLAFQYDLNRGNVKPEEFERFRQYFPHVAQAVMLGKMFDEIRARYSAVLSMLDRVDIGMLLVNSDGEVIVENNSANRTIVNSARLTIDRSGKLIATQGRAAELQEKIKKVASTVVSNGQTSTQYIKLGEDDDSDSLVVELSPLVDTDYEVDNKFRGCLLY